MGKRLDGGKTDGGWQVNFAALPDLTHTLTSLASSVSSVQSILANSLTAPAGADPDDPEAGADPDDPEVRLARCASTTSTPSMRAIEAYPRSEPHAANQRAAWSRWQALTSAPCYALAMESTTKCPESKVIC
eukprot:s1804_g9.t1